jgi:glycosidase
MRSSSLIPLAALLLLGLVGCGQPAAPVNPPAGGSAANGAPEPLAAVDWRAGSIYFLMTDRFYNGNPANDNGGPGDNQPAQTDNPMAWQGGDFQGVIDKINAGYFNKLGVTAIWMTPAYLQGPPQPGPSTDNPQNLLNYPYHGYWPWNFQYPDPHFGRPATLQALVQDAHQHGLAVILGQIVNDAGYGYPAYQRERQQIASGQLTLSNSAQALQTFQFHHRAASGLCEPYSGAYNARLDCPLSNLPDWNSDNLQVQRYLDQSTSYWLSTYGLDGIRLDAAMYVPNTFWAQYFSYLHAQGEHPLAFGEVFNGSPSFVGSFTQPQVGFSSAENYPLYFAITQSGLVPGQSAFYGYSNLAAVNYAVEQNLKADAHPNLMINFIDDQDVPRFTSLLSNNGVAPGQILPRWQIAELLSYTLPGIPVIYYGDEAGMTGTYDPYQAVASGDPSNNDRQPMTVWTSAQRQAAGVQDYYSWLQDLNGLKASQAALQTGSYAPLFVPSSSDPNLFVYARSSGSQTLDVLINATGNAVTLDQLPGEGNGIPETGLPAGPTTDLLGGSSPVTVTASGSGTALNGTLPAWSALVLK